MSKKFEFNLFWLLSGNRNFLWIFSSLALLCLVFTFMYIHFKALSPCSYSLFLYLLILCLIHYLYYLEVSFLHCVGAYEFVARCCIWLGFLRNDSFSAILLKEYLQSSPNTSFSLLSLAAFNLLVLFLTAGTLLIKEEEGWTYGDRKKLLNNNSLIKFMFVI